MSRELRVFRRLVRLIFPEDFRGGYETEMARTYGAQRREAGERGRLSVLRLWVETLADLGRTRRGSTWSACDRHSATRGGRWRRSTPQRWRRFWCWPSASLRRPPSSASSMPRFCVRAVRRSGTAGRDPGTDAEDVAPWELSYTAVWISVATPARSSRSPPTAERRAPRRTGPAVDRGDLVSPNLLETLRVRRWPAAASIRMKTCRTARPWCSSAKRSPRALRLSGAGDRSIDSHRR